MQKGGRGYCLGGTVRYTQINSLFPSILVPIQLEKRVLSWNDHCLIVVAVPEWRNIFANKKKGQTSGTQEGPWDCLWREANETGVIRRGILGGLHRISLSSGPDFAGELRGCVTSDKLKTLPPGKAFILDLMSWSFGRNESFRRLLEVLEGFPKFTGMNVIEVRVLSQNRTFLVIG
ncbi:hypothetical protein CDAR_564611 [Caerostris darwini]|uniref:Uncharacterized protein n=1 Tax=Caerostris darwini TaxID=1538125 RepID=A0AAV4TP55_9ARAC|nr:hypothetical protein CDAR_564611 [Caerostris darwini]